MEDYRNASMSLAQAACMLYCPTGEKPGHPPAQGTVMMCFLLLLLLLPKPPGCCDGQTGLETV